ncbi:hypothetical protein H4R27_002338 [Coemansia aciculifera]|nr:hypothetical protein H4R27_002338 [Coemansia aciculifera]
MNPATCRPTEVTNTTTAQPGDLGFTTASLDLPLEAPLQEVDGSIHITALPAGVSDAPRNLVPPAGIFDTGHIFALHVDGFGAGYTIAPLGVNSVTAHMIVPLTTSFDPVLTFAPLDADFDAVSAISSRATSSGVASASSSTAPSRSASPSTAPPSPERHKVNSRESSVIVQSSDSETGASSSGQNGSTIIIRDSSDEAVTSDQFSKLFRPFIFIRLDMIFVIYLQLVGRELAVTPVSLQELNRQLDKIEGFKIWSHGLRGVDGSFLVRRGARYQQMCLRLRGRLRIPEGAAVVSAPLLYFHLLTLGCVSAKQLSNAVLPHMFKIVTGCEVSSRLVITETGPQTYSTLEICKLARAWLVNLCTYIIKEDRMLDLLNAADKYYEEYKEKCGGRVNVGAVFDPDGSIGQAMLGSDDPAIKLILGLHRKDLLELYRFLPCMTDGVFVDAEKSYLKLTSRFASTMSNKQFNHS